MTAYQVIEQPSQLVQLYELMSQASCYYLDSEFIKVSTLRPQLGLFQLNIDGHIYLLDGHLQLDYFWTLLYSVPLNVFHGCSEDIDLIHYYSDRMLLTNIFDTQIGLSFLGYGLQLSYQHAVKKLLDIDVSKDETRSNWLERPLRAEQLNYAASDVEHLPALFGQIESRLQQKSLWDAAAEDCRSLVREVAFEQDVQHYYREIGTFKDTSKQLMQLQQLYLWREQMAKAMNVPRSFILKNIMLRQLVEENPRTPNELAQIGGIRTNILREHSKTILDLLHRLPAIEQWPARLPRPFRPRDQALTSLIKSIIERQSHDMGIPSDVLMRKKWLNSLFELVALSGDEQSLSPYLQGWRHALVTKPILDVLFEHRQMIQIEMAPLKDLR